MRFISTDKRETKKNHKFAVNLCFMFNQFSLWFNISRNLFLQDYIIQLIIKKWHLSADIRKMKQLLIKSRLKFFVHFMSAIANLFLCWHLDNNWSPWFNKSSLLNRVIDIFLARYKLQFFQTHLLCITFSFIRHFILSSVLLSLVAKVFSQISAVFERNWSLQRDLFLKEMLLTAELIQWTILLLLNSSKNNLITFIVEHWIKSLQLIVKYICDI